MTMLAVARISRVITALVAAVLCAGCGGAAPPPPPAYAPTYSYKTPPAAQKIDVTVGLVAPQFTADGSGIRRRTQTDDTEKRFVSALRTSFDELLVAKGFNITGPFDSVDNMTYPEKKTADFVIFPELDLSASLVTNTLPGSYVCQWTVNLGGNVSLVAKEPLSGEKMWIKRVDVPNVSKNFQGPESEWGNCEIRPVPQKATNELLKGYEAIYAVTMQALDRYVSGEEFQVLKKQSQELRAKKDMLRAPEPAQTQPEPAHAQPAQAHGQCTSNDECRGGRVCRGGVCVYPGCTKDIDCPPNQMCEKSACVAPRPGTPPSCSKDTECGGDQICEKGSCVTARPAAPTPPPSAAQGSPCQSNIQCPGDLFCSSVTHTCTAPSK